MPSKNPGIYLQDIRTSIDHNSSFLGGMDLLSYRQDLKTRRAGERELQILTEAAFRLRDEAETLCPEVEWRPVRAFGNFLRHSYEQVSDQIMWNTIKQDLPWLDSSIAKALQTLRATESEGL